VLLFSLLGLTTYTQASTQCVLTATPAQLRQGGLAEPLGAILLSCGGASPFTPMRGSFQIAVSTVVSNRLVDGKLPEIQFSIASGSNWTPLTAVVARPVAFNSVSIENIDTMFDAYGALSMLISGLRAESDTLVRAVLSYSGTPQLPVQFSMVSVGGEALTLASSGTTTTQYASAALPDGFDFNTLLSRRVPFLTTRVTEASGSTFVATSAGAANGLRLLVKFTGVVKQAALYIPDAIAGSTAKTPTSAADMGLAASPGEYISGSPSTLLLTRIRGADSTGAGGEPAFTPQAGLNTLGTLGLAEYDPVLELRYAVYEVVDAAEGAMETFQFPAFVVLPPEYRAGGPLVRQSAMLAPIGTGRGVSATAPVPRFLPNAAQNDCPLLNDCAANYFPRITAHSISPLFFWAPAGSGHQIGYIFVDNAGGGILEWAASVRYRTGSDWIRFFPPAGIQRSSIRFDVLPVNLAPGTYQADLVVTGKANAGEIQFPITIEVTAPPPPNPTVPPPVVTGVFNAANRVPSPVAPASLAVVLGGVFTEPAKVTVAGVPARVLEATADTLLIEIPATLPDAPQASIVVDVDSRLSAPYQFELAPVAPAAARAFNPDGALNTESTPITTGTVLALHVTGIRFAGSPLWVRLHDREIAEFAAAPPDAVNPIGIDVLRFVVPVDLPTMTTSLVVCGAPAGQPELRGCSHPFDVHLLAAPATQ
jgi:hypothetical protein